MTDETRVGEIHPSGLSLRWQWALFGLPLVVAVVGAMLVTTLWGKIAELPVWSQPPTAPAAHGDAIGDVGGFSVEAFHYPRPTGYVIPATAPFLTFPVLTKDDEFEDGCTTRQHHWLAQHARPATDSQSLLTLVNSRTWGDPIVVSDIRAVGVSKRPTASTMRFYCTPAVGGPQPLQPGLLTIGSREVAVYAPVNEAWTPGRWLESRETQTPSTPVTYTLQPGEDAHLLLEYETAVDFDGRLIATVFADGSETTVNLSTERILLASVVSEDDLWFTVERGAVHCHDLRPEEAVHSLCTPEQVDEYLAFFRYDPRVMNPA